MSDSEMQITLFERLKPAISSERLGTYLTAAGFDQERALKIYVWNACVGEAFHLPIQGVEVALRNSVNVGLCATFTDQWWTNEDFLRICEKEQKDDLNVAFRRIQNRKKPLITGQVVATLSFGFWVAMLRPRYNPRIWSLQLRSAFPHLPKDKTRYDLDPAAKRIADLRNRIWHHEPIFRMSLSEEYRAVMVLLSWLSPTKAEWIRPQCRVPALLRAKP